MTVGELREPIELLRINTPQGPHQIFNPTEDEVELFCKVWAKREDKTQTSRWQMVNVDTVDKKQFIIRHRKGLPEKLAVRFNGKIYVVVAVQDLDNKKHWSMLLAGVVGDNGSEY